MGAIEIVEKTQMVDRPQMQSGDTVKVHVKVREGDKERVQIFEGVVIGMHRGGVRASFTVRKNSYGVGVERTFPLHSPRIERIELKSRGVVRRSRLYYLRDLTGKKACKARLLEVFGLPEPERNIPVIGIVSRLADSPAHRFAHAAYFPPLPTTLRLDPGRLHDRQQPYFLAVANCLISAGEAGQGALD